MPRTQIPLQEVTANSPLDQDVAYTAGDAANGMYFDNSSGNVVLLMTSSAGGKTATLPSVVDQYGRLGPLAPAPAAGKTAWVGPLRPALYNERALADLGRVHIDITPDATGVAFAAVKFVPAA